MADWKIKKWVGDAAIVVGGSLYYGVGSIVGTVAKETINAAGDIADNIKITDVEGRRPGGEAKEFFQSMFESTIDKKDDLVLNLVMLFAGLAMLAKTPMTIADFQGEKTVTQPLNKSIRPSLLDQSAALQAGLRKFITDDNLKDTLAKTGFTDADIDTLKKLQIQFLDRNSVLSGMLRGIISEGKAGEILSKTGYSAEDIEVLKMLSFHVPGAQDLITFAVREVYSPGVAAKFGQYQELDAVWGAMEKDAKAAGLNKETFSKYWAAHWVLPSIMQGFEMLHRGKINDSDLDSLFTALDVMPFWRSKLKDISYNPLTRVDVRRMHKLRLIDEGELLRRYKDIGYSDEDAAKMVAFTLEYNADPSPEDLTLGDQESIKERDLSKGELVKAYSTGLMKIEDVKGFLTDLGYSTDEIDYLIGKEDYKKESDRMESYIKLYKQMYIQGTIDETGLASFFGELNIPDKQQEYYRDMWDVERVAKTAIPSKSELVRFYKKGIITESKLRTELSYRKYSEEYIKWYIKDLEETEE